MSPHPALEKLREQLGCLEERQRRFSRIIPVADAVDLWLPYGGLPTGCIHEVKGANLAIALAFSAILSVRIAAEQGKIIYIAPGRSLYPLGLLPYGMNLNQVLFVSVRRSQDLAWAVLEALRCPQVSAVMTVWDGVDLTGSRRLQLAAENSGATGFLLGSADSAPVAAPITRWKVSSHAGKPNAGKPEQRLDEPAWTLDLRYCRGGRPGNWTIQWRNQRLSTMSNSFTPKTLPTTHTLREAVEG